MAEDESTKDKENKDEKREPPAERESTTQHTIEVDGSPVPYRAVAGTVHLKDDEGKVKAVLFYVSYTREGVEDPATRPVTFAFNGGPGSAAVWLHLGVLGPRRVDVGDSLSTPPPPYALLDNGRSPLDFTDLVFIDPVSTGWSRPAPGQDAKEFYGVKEDAESVSDFIRLWLTREKRWRSPKYVIGESYGTTRASALSLVLQDRHGIYVNGIVLVSAVLYLQSIQVRPGNDLPYPLYLPSYAVVALYHGRIPAANHTLDTLAAEADDFALRDYTSTLMRTGRLTEAERARTVRRLQAYTGLPRDYIEGSDLRIHPMRFQKELLRGERRTIGRFDARVKGFDPDAPADKPEYDPSYNLVGGAYSAAVNHYLRDELGYEEDQPYRLLADVSPWKWVESHEGGFLEVGSRLRTAMAHAPAMRVLLMSGYYDLATPFAGAEWTLDHMRVDDSLRGNIVKRRYEAGHMMYIHEPSLRAMREDLKTFMTE